MTNSLQRAALEKRKGTRKRESRQTGRGTRSQRRSRTRNRTSPSPSRLTAKKRPERTQAKKRKVCHYSSNTQIIRNALFSFLDSAPTPAKRKTNGKEDELFTPDKVMGYLALLEYSPITTLSNRSRHPHPLRNKSQPLPNQSRSRQQGPSPSARAMAAKSPREGSHRW